jgi:hypothetical protein
MTGILAMKANAGEEGIVIASDTQVTLKTEEEMVEKRPIFKIWLGKTWAMAHSGGFHNGLYRLQGLLAGQKRYDSSEDHVRSMIQRAVTPNDKGLRRFVEIDDINCDIRSKSTIDDCTEFIFAHTEPNLGLWQVHEFGVLQDYKEVNAKSEEDNEREFEYLFLGSAEDRIKGYIEDRLADSRNPLDPNNITIPIAVKEARGALDKARRDPYSGGASDIVVLTNRNGVDTWGKEIRRRMEHAEDKIYDEIIRKYSDDSNS